MNCTGPLRAKAPLLTSTTTTSSTLRLLTQTAGHPLTTRTTFLGLHHHTPSLPFSSSTGRSKDFFPQPSTPAIQSAPPAWPHPIYTAEQMAAVAYSHRSTRTWSDRVALTMVRVLRWGLDKAMGYGHGPGFVMTERKYMIRNIFLESVAGVPGMVAGMLRHLHSMRRMKRDNGWMETLLEESYNERMHLLVFLKMAEPGWFMRVMVLATQGIFFNTFFLAYLLSPQTCHRFVGYLEEEAVLTYTREIADLDAGKLPAWARAAAPDMAVAYWNMPPHARSVRDLLLYIRADESKHREVNHTLANLDQRNDPNPYVSVYRDPHRPRPGKGIEVQKPQGWEREEVLGAQGGEIP